MVRIEALKQEDETALFEFEFNNRLFFENWVPSRGEEYFIYKNFRFILQDLLEEQMRGESYFYIIKDQLNSIVGRINLIDVDKGKRLCHIGYRIGENFAGKGIATKALELVLKEAVKKNISEIHAKATNVNIASQKVLEKMNFRRIGFEKGATFRNGEKLDFIHYMWKEDTVSSLS